MNRAFRKTQYRAANVLTYNKGENSITMLFDFIVILTILSRKTSSFLEQYNIAEYLLYFYIGSVSLLLICRVLWNYYSKSRYAGIVEVLSNYLTMCIAPFLIGGELGISMKGIIISTIMIILYYVISIILSVWYGKRKEIIRKISHYIFYGVVIFTLITIPMGYFLKNNTVLGLGAITFAMMSTLKYIPYWLILDTPYRRNLIKEFGPKDIDKSAIFISKKKEK